MTAYPVRLKLSFQEDEGVPPIQLGSLLLDAQHMVKLEPAKPEFAVSMKEIETEINKMTYFHIDVPPPQPSTRFESWAKVVERGSPDFLEALKETLRRAFGLDVDGGAS